MCNKSLINYLITNNILYKKNQSLTKFSYFKTGGNINLIIFPSSISQIQELVKYLNNANIDDYFVFGNTSNCIFRNNTNIDIIITLKKMNSLVIEKNKLTVSAGVMIPKLVQECVKHGILGFEGLEGIPATIGGAVYANAGSYGYIISDNIIRVIAIDKNGRLVEFLKKNLELDFRTSVFNQGNDCIIVSVEFAIVNQAYTNINLIKSKIKHLKKHRHKYLEYKLPNVGSVFKTNDIYNNLAKQNFIYYGILFFTRAIIYRIIRAKDNKLLNSITFKYFGISNKGLVSEKTMNTVVNKNEDTELIEKYISKIQKISNNTLELEIEII